MSTPSGYRLEQAMATLQRALADGHDEDGVLLDPAEAEDDAYALLDRVLRGAVEADAMAEMAKERIRIMSERQLRYATRRDSLRATAFSVFDVLEIKKRELPDLTASIKHNPPRVVITDETQIPLSLTKTTTVIDKIAVKAALAIGPVPGAELSNSLPSISIRTR